LPESSQEEPSDEYSDEDSDEDSDEYPGYFRVAPSAAVTEMYPMIMTAQGGDEISQGQTFE
jgi:hypothetical protein